MKYGNYALYQGREYKAARDQDTILLYSKDPCDLQHGFFEKRPGVYTKSLSFQEVETVYAISYQAVYGGRTFPANETGMGSILLMHSGFEGLEEALEMGFKMVEPGVCEKEVQPDEVEQLIEVKRPIWGFTTA
ncbi:hypothetical protein JJB07_22850 [Tumebacillus sp. ITR2]|uniref:Uncharacterized protein n=1 Tax=Tumebacillus amylolyticus TaxID=2801339 RepID=A0ABS1JH64_9BACL|nr:hypothetical protein [Tumebacillus amylolyticus]MBL0389434.1 hypothetical protein [Tumebacillus amylolyticus]